MGRVCWIAQRDARAGKDYGEEIINAIEEAACTVLILSSASNSSAFVKREIERAASKNKPILPILIEPVKPSPGLELFISSSQWIDASNGRLSVHLPRISDEILHARSSTTRSESRRENFLKQRRAKKRRKLILNSAIGLGIVVTLAFGFERVLTAREKLASVPAVNGLLGSHDVPDAQAEPDPSLAETVPEGSETSPSGVVPVAQVEQRPIALLLADRRRELRDRIEGGEIERALELLNSTILEFPPAQTWADVTDLAVQTVKTKLLGEGLPDARGVAEEIKYLANEEGEVFPAAMELYGMMLLNGIGVTEDDAHGFSYLKKAALHHRAPALYALGICHMTGEGTSRDNAAASSSFEEVLGIDGWSEAHNRATGAYAVLNHQQGKGLTPENQKVYDYLLTAADHDYLPAQAKQAVMLINGDGVKRDVMAGFQLLEDASEKDDTTAMLLLADVLEQAPPPVQKDLPRAAALREKADLNNR